MANRPVFDLLLLGYRDDVAPPRAAALLRRLSSRYPLAAAGRDKAMPYRLFAGVDHQLGLDLCAQLRGAGAQVRLVAAEAEEPVSVPPIAERRTPPLRMILLLLLLATVGILQVSFNHGDTLHISRDAARPKREAGNADRVGRSPRLSREAVALGEKGAFAANADRLRAAIREESNRPTLQKNLRVVLHNWAVAELNAGRPENASRIIQQALHLGEDPRLLLVSGVAVARTGDLAGARKALERALAMGAGDAQTLLALGRVYQEDGNREGAVEMFQRARDLGIGDPDFTITLRRLERELDAEWDYTELVSSHFTISFAEGENYDAARRVIESLEEAYFSVGRKLDFYSSERVPVVLYDSEEFHDITQAPSWMGALYDGRIKLPVHGLDQGSHPMLDRSVRHEYAHAIVSQLTRGNCPVWLSEGVAIWAEESVDGERLAWAEAAVGDRELFLLDVLQGPFTRLPPDRVPVAYAQSYLAVRSLLDDFGPRDVRELLSSLGAGTPLSLAFETIFSRPLADFENHVARSLTG